MRQQLDGMSLPADRLQHFLASISSTFNGSVVVIIIVTSSAITITIIITVI